MSASLSGLEKALGTAVFQRSHRGVNLTPAGHALLRKARQLIEDVHELQATAHELDKELHGSLIVGCYSTLAPSLMPPIITSFLRTYPKIDLRFIEGSDDELIDALYQGQCEFVLTYDYRLERFFPHSALHKEDLSAAAPYAVVPASHHLAREETIDLTDLAAEPLILLDLAPAPEYFLQIFDRFDLMPQIRFRTKSHQLIFGLVAHGMGSSILTQVPAPSGSAPYRDIAVKPLSNDLEPLPIVALSAAGIRRTQRAEAFINHVKSRMGHNDHKL